MLRSGTEADNSLGKKSSLNYASSCQCSAPRMLKVVGKRLLSVGGLEVCRRALGMLGEEEAMMVLESSAKLFMYLSQESLGCSKEGFDIQ